MRPGSRRDTRIVCATYIEKEAGLPSVFKAAARSVALLWERLFVEQEKKGNVAALLPIGVFLLLYLGLGIVFEYVMGISMGFYNIPIVVVFLIALLVACLQNRALSFDDKLAVMGKGIGDKTIVTMVLIFMAAGIFVGVVGRDSAESVAYLLLSVIPAEYAVAVLFVVSCFVSVAMGTSVGTITLITPIAVAVFIGVGLRHAPVHRERHGRRDVRRQPFVHIRHYHCGVPGAGLQDAGQVPRELQDCPSCRARHADLDFDAFHGGGP